MRYQNVFRRVQISAAVGLLIVLAAGCGKRESVTVEREVKFGLLADVQYAGKTHAGTRYYRNSKEKLTRCVTDLNTKDIDFVIQLGDLIDGGPNAAAELDEMLAVYNRINAEKYHTMGNHDFAGIDRNAVLSKMALDKGYCDFTVDNWRFVILDTLDVALIGGWPEDSENYKQGKEMLNRLKDQNAVNAVSWNGGIGEKQKAWLADVLADARKKHQQVIAFGHCPLVPAGDVHNLWNAQQIAIMLEDSDCVAAYFAGHNHHGNYQLRNSVHYVTLRGMVETPDQNAYAVIKLKPDKIEITGFGRVQSKTLVLCKD
ncbi:MAG: metallophosphoesterase [Anaerohalosphaera sp.]|nr:metallophosphoesterase [Anaerohalosphaera sp.]